MATGRKKKVGKKAAKKVSKKESAQPVASAPAETIVAEEPVNPFTKQRELSPTEKASRLRALRTHLKERLYPASEGENQYMLRRPTGVIELDIALGGGFPAGGASMISGPFNSGKSWLLFRTIAMQQQIYGKDFYGALHVGEQAFPYDQAISAGVRIEVPDALLNQAAEARYISGLPQFTQEELAYFKTSIGRLETISGVSGEETLGGVLDCVQQDIFSVIGVDSIASLRPEADLDKDLSDDERRGSHATMMKRFWMRYSPLVNRGKNATTVLFIQQVVANQERANMNPAIQKYIQEWTVKGGESSKHYKLIDLVMWSGEKIKGGSDIAGKWIKYKTLKGKAGTHDNITGEFPYYYHLGGVDLHGELIASALRRGVLVHVPQGIQLFSATTRQPIEGASAQDEAGLREALAKSFDLELVFRREILSSAGKQCLYR